MAKSSRSIDAIHRSFRYLHETVSFDNSTFANMMAGHAIALSFAAIIFVMWGINAFAGTSMTIVSVALSIFMMLLEILVCFIQALVFTMLSAVFISLAHVKPEKK